MSRPHKRPTSRQLGMAVCNQYPLNGETMLPNTVDRDPNQTCEVVNDRIRLQTEQNIARLKQAGPAEIARRLEELDAEWDIERTLEANAASVSLIGITLGATVDRRWFALPAVVGFF